MRASAASTASCVRLLHAMAAVVCLASSALAAAAGPLDEIEAPLAPKVYEPMSADVRSAVERVAILPSEAATSEAISGTYDRAQPGLVGGADAGRRRAGVSGQVGGVNVHVPVPILQIPSAIFGGLSGAAKEEIQEFRDALTEDIMNADSQPLMNSALALDVHRHVSNLSPVEAQLLSSVDGNSGYDGGGAFRRFRRFQDGHRRRSRDVDSHCKRRADAP